LARRPYAHGGADAAASHTRWRRARFGWIGFWLDKRDCRLELQLCTNTISDGASTCADKTQALNTALGGRARRRVGRVQAVWRTLRAQPGASLGEEGGAIGLAVRVRIAEGRSEGRLSVLFLMVLHPDAALSGGATWPVEKHALLPSTWFLLVTVLTRPQIRTLLIDCLVMTNLFYPSFAMFLDRHFGAASTVAQPARAPSAATSNGPGTCGDAPAQCTPCWWVNGGLVETFYPHPPPLLPNVEWGPWWAAKSGAAAGDAQWVPAPVGGSCSDASVELMRVAWADVGDVLDADHHTAWTPRDDQIVAAVRSLAEGWEGDSDAEAARCVRHLVDAGAGIARPEGLCYLLAPRDAARIPGSTDLADLWTRRDEQEMYRGIIVPFHKPANHTAFERAWARRTAEALAPLGAEVFTETYAGGKQVECSTPVSVSGKTLAID
jgi:hypothetical protein